MKARTQKIAPPLLALSALALIVFHTSTAHAQNLLANGGFEAPLVSPSVEFGYQFRVGAELDGWTVATPTARGVAQYDTRYHAVSTGSQAIEFEDVGQTVSQTFPTVIRGTYDVTFDLGANVASGMLRVTAGPTTNILSTGGTNYARRTVTFTADASATTLTFEKFAPQDAYPLLDSVSVVLVAQPDEATAYIRTSEVEVSWLSKTNRAYQVQYRSTLTTNNWVDLLSTNLSGTGAPLSVPDHVPLGQPLRFYRVVSFIPN